MEIKNKTERGCEQFERFASYTDKYIDGELTEKEINELFDHVENCPECRRYLEITVKTEEAVDVPDMTPLPHGLHAQIMASVKNDAAKNRAKEHHAPKISRLVPLAAAFLCIFLVAAFFMSTPPRLSGDKATAENNMAGDAPTENTEQSPSYEDMDRLPPPSTAAPSDNEPSRPETDSSTSPSEKPSADSTSASVNTDSVSPLDSDDVTFIMFGLCAIFAFASVAALTVFVFAAKKNN